MMIIVVIAVSSMFCGHLGKIEMDSVTLAVGVINITGISIGCGINFGCDTLLSQTYGSKNLKRVGTIMQRGILILMLCCFPCWALFINTEQILLLCKQNPDIARLTQKYVMIFIPALPAVFLQQLQFKYLQNQSIIWPQVFIGIAVNIVNASINAILLFVLKMGVEGSAWASTISHWAMSLTLFLYIICNKLHVETWGGLISVVELGGQAIMMELVIITGILQFGIGLAASVRIGIALGAGDVEQAKKSCKVALYCSAFGCMLVSGLSLALKNVIGYVFTNDRDVITLISNVILLFAAFHLCDGINQTCGGIFRGTGKQKIGAITNIFGYYLIGFPIALSLMFIAKLGIMGLWIGMFCPVLLQTCIYIPYIFHMNWQKACEEARIRAGVKPIAAPDPTISQTDVIKSERSLLENGGMTMSGSSCNVMQENIQAPGEDHAKQPELKDDPPMETTNVVGEILSTKQLIVRRGLALLLAIGVLMIGIAVKLLTTKT